MKKLLKGLREFQSTYFSTHRELFEELSHGQKPRILFVTCSDSRIDPNLITNAQVGELFVIRNAGNIIPPFGAANGGEGAAVEYAVQALGIEHIIVCGHSHCGAMKGLLKRSSLEEEMPLVYEWLKHAEATRRLLKENYSTLEGEPLLDVAIAENVLTQIDNLRTYPVIHAKLHQQKLHLHAWVYHIETGDVLEYDAMRHAFVMPDENTNVEASPMQCILSLPDSIDELSPHKLHQLEAVEDHRKDPAMPWLSAEQTSRIYGG
ncbi:carbonic anhydrase [Leptolyngbya valderiana BDU 20041]|nr:carbonic anhydrase [Geitlerinema sp. CS-897]OAB63479.1 carbonic anhydrase [Leptolyngbya valderiana BDU 20041]PPT10917.1 Carbonic anhydrase [Geitlerinema sp. FC II]